VDIANAFNSVDRLAMQAALSELAPGLLPWFEFTHGQPSPLFCRSEVLWSTQGTQQGDPLGPAFFAVTIQKVISNLRDLPGIDWQVWYLDDGVLVGEPVALMNALHELTVHFEKLGLKVNLAKCKIWSPQDVAGGCPIPVVEWSSPKAVLGTPFGSEAAIRQFLSETRAKHHALLQRLALLPDPQVALSLLRYCLGAQKVNHLLRVLHSSNSKTFAEETEEDLRFTLDCVLGTCLPDAAWRQSCLPIRMGGLGIQNPSVTQHAAYFSSALAEYSGAFSPDGETATPLDSLWFAAGELYGQTESPELSQWLAQHALPAPAQVNKDQLFSQHYWAEKVHLQMQKNLVADAPLRDKVRLTSEGHKHAGAWLSVVPNSNLGFHFDKAEYLLLTHFHLGLPLLPAAAAGTPCDQCGQPLDVFGDHLVSCRHAGAWKRHNSFCDAVAAVAESIGVLKDTEVEVSGRERPADLLIAHWSHGRDAAVDPTIIHSLNPSHPWDPKHSAMEKAEAAKHVKSDEPCAQANLGFVPVAADTFGAYGLEGERFLAQLFSRFARRFGNDGETSVPGKLQSECWQRVAVALRRAVAKQLGGAYSQSGGAWVYPFRGEGEEEEESGSAVLPSQ
jgi:hypothetical protein